MGNIKYISLGSNEAEHLNKPLEVIKLKWGNLEPKSIYLIRISCGSEFIALVQTYGQLTHGSVLITSYGLLNPIYAVLRNTTWTEYSLITNSDLQTRFNPIIINGELNDTFAKALKDKSNSSVNFIAFTNNPTDNPFSFNAGYVIVFHSGLINSNNIFMLIGVSATTIPQVEAKRLDVRT